MTQAVELLEGTGVGLVTEGWALVVDDHPMFCDALELTLRSICDFDEIRTANCLTDALETLEKHGKPSLVVLDLNMPDVTGLDGLARIVSVIAPHPVIVVSSLADNKNVTAALKLGAAGYVPKHSPRSTFKAALDTLSKGRVFVPDSFIPTELPTRQSEALKAVSSLTPQQARILELICNGLLNKQIAYELSIAEATVKAHVTAIMRKLRVQNRTQAVLVAKEAKFSSILPDTMIQG
ncbi:MAG: response regulator transcription factor [Pseudomonadota bacterium]